MPHYQKLGTPRKLEKYCSKALTTFAYHKRMAFFTQCQRFNTFHSTFLYLNRMINHRLLTGLLCHALCSINGVCISGQSTRVIPLEEIFEITDRNSVHIRPLQSATEEARQEISVARTGYMPEISASLSFGYIGDGFTTKRDYSDRQKAPIPHFSNGLSLNIEQPVYTGGAVTATVDMAKLKSTAARYAEKLGRDNIRFRLTGFYLDIYKYSNLQSVIKANIAAAEKVLAEMHSRHEQGMILSNDITRYELLIADLRLQLVKIDNVLNVMNHNLVLTAGLPDGTIVVPDSTILSRSLHTASESVWQREAERNSPLLQLAQSEVEISRKAESLIRADKLPKISLQAGWSIDGPILTEIPPINRNLSYWFVGVGLHYNISSLFKTNKSITKSCIATRTAAESFESARENLNISINADYVKYLEAYEELKTREKSLELAQRNYQIVATRYSADMALITDMLDAANSRLNSEQQLVNAKINIIYYYYKLLFTSGKI